MFWVELAIYIFIIVSLIHFSQYFLWLIFGLFTYRFWTLLLPFETVTKLIPIEKTMYYTILIIIITVITYFIVMWATESVPFLRYVFLCVIALYTLRKYDIADVMFFKDVLEAHGMWDVEYWKNAVKNIFNISENPDGILGIFKSIGQKIMDIIGAFANYIKSL